MFNPRYRVEYLAYADDPMQSYWDWLDEFYTYRGAWKAIQKLSLMRHKNNARKSQFKIIDIETESVTEVEITSGGL